MPDQTHVFLLRAFRRLFAQEVAARDHDEEAADRHHLERRVCVELMLHLPPRTPEDVAALLELADEFDGDVADRARALAHLALQAGMVGAAAP